MAVRIVGVVLLCTVAQISTQTSTQTSTRTSTLTGIAATATTSIPVTDTVVAPRTIDVEFSGYIQADGVFYDQSSVDEQNPSTGELLNDTRFLIRRARLRAEVTYAVLSGRVELDANTVRGPTARIISADVSARWPAEVVEKQPLIMGTIGLFKVPFGFEVQELVEARHFLEESNVARGLFPGNYDLGLRIQGGWRFLRYQLAAMNGNPIGERQFPGRDPNEAKDFLGRVGIDAEIFDGLRIEAGFSALTGKGFSKGTPSTKDQIVWRDVNENGIIELSELQAISGTAATPSENFDRSALGADLRLRAELPVLGRIFIYGEIIRAVNLDRALFPADPIAAGRDLRELGFSIGVAQELGDHWLIGARYDRYDPDLDTSFSTLALVAAWRIPLDGKLMLEYDLNANPFGADDAVTLRAQAGF